MPPPRFFQQPKGFQPHGGGGGGKTLARVGTGKREVAFAADWFSVPNGIDEILTCEFLGIDKQHG
ncbi:MAG: hypothetical protein ABIT37_21005 [Luteolibacter sp.]